MKKLDNNPRKRFALVLFFIVLVVILLYGLFQARNLILGPVIVVKTPLNGTTTTEKVLKIEGNARNIAFIRLNGRQIFVDDLGAFREELILSSGYNIITLNATDKFGRSTKKVLEIILETENETELNIEPAIETTNSTTTNQQ
ncbi:MAG: hypothetical protein CO184_01440 [Candidatus Zambryskibacteria bacterium CG_4_9_14_3_um_filter_40_16]|uniref:Uncharacterized protein n=2 Tax=Candidatus Zambryskiibacteriota TaxID=1817925 RepID=A0A2H0K7D0_9BACT|nr:MAG: hypothetical protein COV95_00165 [Candidatus Zambryskibacteria bacterium CG11_big_fil_rev_8_21_14_0_20_40_24]PJA33624.1 MAG: hypothetical protein CO184_01440 [Candidatus Zambryskibacteria bacterium CG_4_9_14_3_um_filter_40_16]